MFTKCLNLVTIWVIIGFITTIILTSSFIDCNPGGKKNKYRGNRTKSSCHLKEVHDCVEKIDHYPDNPEAYKLITSDQGIDTICSNSQDAIGCLKDHMEKCSTPIQSELFDFAIERFQKYIDRFCKSSELREEFLRHSLCIADTVLAKPEYKVKCNQPFLAAMDTINKQTDFDDKLDLTCCSYNRWINCLLEIISASCHDSGKQAMNNFLDKSFAGLSSLICTSDEFSFTSNRCKSLYPPEGTTIDPNQEHNLLIKAITSHFSFLITK